VSLRYRTPRIALWIAISISAAIGELAAAAALLSGRSPLQRSR
jgi:hypothetical protein